MATTHELEMIDSAARAQQAVEGELPGERMILNMGPQHPSTHGVLRVVIELDGEEITNVWPPTSKSCSTGKAGGFSGRPIHAGLSTRNMPAGCSCRSQ